MGSGEKRKSLVLDSTAFYAGIPFSGTEVYYTTPLVIGEVSHGRVRELAVTTLVDTGRLRVLEPEENFVRQVKEAALRSGDLRELTQTDLSVLAIALQLSRENQEVMIISDDYAVENLARLLKITHAPIMTRGIAKVFHWLVYCSGCGKVFEDRRIEICDVCGTRLKRKIKR